MHSDATCWDQCLRTGSTGLSRCITAPFGWLTAEWEMFYDYLLSSVSHGPLNDVSLPISYGSWEPSVG